MQANVVITGGTSGIGLATALRFVQAGDNVIVIGRNPQKTQAVQKQYPALHTVIADLSKISAINAAFETINQQYGSIDTLFVNAGFGIFKAFTKVTEQDFDNMINLNYKGAFFTIQAAQQYMTAGSSIVINVSWTQLRGLKNSSLYSSSKAPLGYLAKALALEFAGRQIRVNAVNPGYTNTEQFNQDQMDPGRYAAMIARVPAGRFGRSDEIADAVYFLAQPTASYINGQSLTIDGGMTAVQAEPEVHVND